MRRTVSVLSLLLSLLAAPASARAQRASAPSVLVPGSEIEVTLVTFGVGEEVFERFGHDALIFHDAMTQQDVAYHWGLFNFNDPGFYSRFLTGDTRYMMGAVDARALLESERRTGRPIVLQRLNLSPVQALALRDFVRWNARDENKYYRYDYFRDNCATRLRDALDRVLGGAIRGATDTVRTTLTYREESVRLTDGMGPVQAGIDVALGRPADAPLTEWDSFFIPMRLRDALRTMRVRGANGEAIPLVWNESMVPPIAGAQPIAEAAVAPSLTVRYLVLGLLLAAIVVALRIMTITRRSAAWGLALFGGAWSLLCGVIGVILLLAWFATRHAFWASNENVLLLTPFSLLLVGLIPAAILSRRGARAARMTAAVVAALGLIAALLSIIPGGQDNLAMVALLLPVHLAIAWALALPRATSHA